MKSKCKIGYPKEGILYYAIVYRKNGVIDLRPEKSESAARDTLQQIMSVYSEIIEKTDIIKVNMKDYNDGYLFSPKPKYDYDRMSKDELKKILTDRNVKFISKYDIGTWRKMCKESEN